MPAIDNCEPAIVRALKKAGWVILRRPYGILTQKGRKIFVYADLLLEHTQNGQQIVVIEVKCFPENRNFLDEFYHSIGQYQVYRIGLKLNKVKAPIYLAVPESAVKNYFHTTLIQTTIKQLNIKLIVVNLEHEEIVEWKA